MTDAASDARLANLRRATESRAAEAHARAQRAITTLIAKGLAVSFAAVALHAGVSVSYLYKTDDLAQRIRESRQAGSRKQPERSARVSSDSSLQTKMDAVIRRNKSLETELASLREENRNLLSRLLAPK